jgi:two-component system cell cycle sensor histidine kinase/response regulator CckA
VARGVATMKEPLNLNVLVSNYLCSPEFLRLEQFHPSITIKSDLNENLLNIVGSGVHIRKLIMNLVSNASEAIKEQGTVTISTINRYVDRPLKGYDEIEIGEYAVLSVSDNGPGISSEDYERIFEPFYTKKVLGRSGTGLGLAVVWNVVQDHQAHIDVNTQESGTRFDIFFPITRDSVATQKSAIAFEKLHGNGEKILVVDDIEGQRDITCKMLLSFSYQPVSVSSGEEAVEYVSEHHADLIVLDMIMDPGINGRVTYERILRENPGQKAIIVSGFAETDDVKGAQELGAGKFLKKPLTLEMLGIAVKEELSK